VKRTKLSTTLLLVFLLLVTHIPVLPLVKGETDVHDLEVSFDTPTLKTPNATNHLSSNSSAILNATVINKGNFTEYNVNVQLLINDTVYLSSTAQKLLPNGTFWSAYLWAPEDGIWNLTVYAPLLISGESNPTNNVASKLVKVSPNEPPIANFGYSPRPPIMNELVTFDASNSTDPDWGNITKYDWDFGDGENGTGMIVNHTYIRGGNKTVTLSLRDTENLINSTPANITVYARPVANFTISGERFVTHELTFNGSKSKDDDGNITSYYWDFGDDINDTGVIARHVYYENATYRLNLTVTDNDGLTGSISEWVTIGLGIPIADFEITQPSPYYVDETLTFNASKSKPDGGNITRYSWYWDDGTTNSTEETSLNHAFSQPDVYNVTLVVTDSDNKNSTPTSKNVTVKLRVLLEVKPTPVWSNPGEPFNVSITVVNVEDLFSVVFNLTWPGRMDRFIDVITAYPGNFTGPHDWFDPEPKPTQGNIWVNATRDVSGTGVYGNWTVAVILFTVRDRTGNHTLHFAERCLKNSNRDEINHTALDGYFYTSWPVANFTHLPESPSVNKDIIFDASASYDPDTPFDPSPGPIILYMWDFGDGNTTIIGDDEPITPIITHTYTKEEDYNVTLTVTDDDGDNWNFTHLVSVRAYVHDVAIIKVEPCKFAFNQTSGVNETCGELPITVTVINNGALQETCNVTLYAKNSTHTIKIGTQTVSLSPSDQRDLTFYLYAFKWNTTHGLLKGDYTISANVTGVEFDINLDNNWLEDGVVRVYLVCDVSGPTPGVPDGIVDMRDIGFACNAFGSEWKDGYYWHDPPRQCCPDSLLCDLNCDGIINMRDIGIACSNFMKTDP